MARRVLVSSSVTVTGTRAVPSNGSIFISNAAHTASQKISMARTQNNSRNKFQKVQIAHTLTSQTFLDVLGIAVTRTTTGSSTIHASPSPVASADTDDATAGAWGMRL